MVSHARATLQILHANKIRGADVNGSSDAMCKVKLGPFKAKTRVLKKTLDPEWNETFSFVLEADNLALMGGVPTLSFEVWDHNTLARDYFLGEVRSPTVAAQSLMLPPHQLVFTYACPPTAKHSHICKILQQAASLRGPSLHMFI